MADDAPTDQISEIEAQIEDLAESAERSRRIILGSKVAIAGGFALLLAALLGLFGSGETAALGSIALVLGGIVSLGSNVSTLRQTEAAISTAEARRARLLEEVVLPSWVRRCGSGCAETWNRYVAPAIGVRARER